MLTRACQPATGVDHPDHPLVNVSRLPQLRNDQSPDRMLRFDDHIDENLWPGAIDPLNRRQLEWLPEGHAQNLRRHGSWITGQPQMETPKPERRSQEFKRPEHIPRECLLELISGNGAESWDWASQSIGMVRGDYEFPAKVGGDVWSQ